MRLAGSRLFTFAPTTAQQIWNKILTLIEQTKQSLQERDNQLRELEEKNQELIKRVQANIDPRQNDDHGYLVVYILGVLSSGTVGVFSLFLRKFPPGLHAAAAEHPTGGTRV